MYHSALFDSQHLQLSCSEERTLGESVLLGASARTIAGITLLPVTVVKTRYEVCFQAFLTSLSTCLWMLSLIYSNLAEVKKKLITCTKLVPFFFNYRVDFIATAVCWMQWRQSGGGKEEKVCCSRQAFN